MSKQATKSKVETQVETQVERERIATKASKDTNRLSSFVSSLTSLNVKDILAKASEQELFVISLAFLRDTLTDAFTFKQYHIAVNASEQLRKLNITSYLYSERMKSEVISQRNSTHAICAERACQRERVSTVHKSAKTSNTFNTVRIASALSDRVAHSDTRKRSREVMHELDLSKDKLAMLETIVKIVSK